MRIDMHLLGIAALAAVGASPAFAASEFRLCVLDQNALLLQSKLAKDMAARFQQVRNQAQQSFDNDSRALDADSRALNSLRKSLPPEVAKARVDNIERRRAQLEERGKQINRDLADLDAELSRNVLTLADPAIRAAQSERGCSMLIARSNLLYLNDASFDITAAVLQKLNAGNPAGKR